ncbi:MAG TPA: 4-phosphopantoate--beta-alanine ligase, partial [Proteobacteria bacterium]|nr:4-phosphopantoate--beta-alanine ligase [Pseudomonadota bacterium]
PEADDFYPEDYRTWVSVDELTESLCGASRPTHFRGVTTVVTKLFNCVKPHYAVFGKKDYQQLKVIERMTRDLNFDIEIVAGETVRESDGLAMSSRNTYLDADERKAATCLIRALTAAKEAFDAGERDSDRLRAIMREVIASEPLAEIDYVEVASQRNMKPISGEIAEPAVMALAVRIGKARLIDNMEIFTEE